MIMVPGGKKKSRAAMRAARAALEANGGSPATDGNQAPLSERPRQCPVFGCTREHAPGNCPTFLDMTPKERLDLVHAKQLCLLCLQHPLSVGCETARQLRGLLEGLGIDPGALEVRIGVWKPGEPGRPGGGDTTDLDVAEAGVGRLISRLMGALTSLCQAGERFVDFAPRRDSGWSGRQEPARQDEEDGADEIGERHRALESSEYARGNQGSLERCGGLQRVVLLTPEGVQLINMGIGRGFVFSVVSQKTAAGYALHRSKLPAPIMEAGPTNQQVCATEDCTMAFPQENAMGGKLIIYACVVDTLEYYETPGDSLQRWQMQLGEEDEGYLQWMRVAQPGDRPH
jgi:hypothetical protein